MKQRWVLLYAGDNAGQDAGKEAGEDVAAKRRPGEAGFPVAKIERENPAILGVLEKTERSYATRFVRAENFFF